ncbi:MAG: hypothetical protein JJ863_20475 [Deltaproteobacteria bacterium]|nr:hypothetical protein [Deltaproteobacteria bacterium]
MIPVLGMILVGFLVLVVSNGTTHRAMGRLQHDVREELGDARVLLELRDARASVVSRGFLSASIAWFSGDLLVTDRGVVFFPVTRGPVTMNQPPIVLVKSGAEHAIAGRPGVTRGVLRTEPVQGTSFMGKLRVSLAAEGRWRRWTLHVETSEPEDLMGALRKLLDEEQPGGAYRGSAKRVGQGSESEPTAPPVAAPRADAFAEGFLHWDPETGFRQSPFTEPIGHRGGTVCFESDASDDTLWREAAEDLAALVELPLADCFYGSGSHRVEPFVAAAAGAGPLTGAEVLRALRARNFRSDYVLDLQRTELPCAGYVGYSINDELHTDVDGQHLFYRGDDEEEDEELRADPSAWRDALTSRAVHEGLGLLVRGPLWYVLLHEDGGTACPLVVLFAVGRSKRGDHLIGVASQQICHDLCD